MTKLERTAETTEMRQLRHQTKNALQRIIAQVSATSLRATPAGALLADEIEHRVCLSARISDALFGLTACPGTLEQRLRSLASATVRLMTDSEQTIETEVVVAGSCPEPLNCVIVRVAYEMLCNAVKHGMHMRLVGRITIRVRSNWDGSTTLVVSDDGWGPTNEGEGEGLPIMRSMAQEFGGVVSINRVDNETVARLHVPAPL